MNKFNQTPRKQNKNRKPNQTSGSFVYNFIYAAPPKGKQLKQNIEDNKTKNTRQQEHKVR